MDNRADTDRIRDDIRTLGSAVARPCALARNSLGASQDRRGVCRWTVAAVADGPRGAALLPAVQRVDDPHAYCWFKTVFRFDLTVTTYTIDDASKSLLFPCRLAAPRACGFMRNSLGISHSKSTRHSCVPAHAGVHDSPISPSGRTRHML